MKRLGPVLGCVLLLFGGAANAQPAETAVEPAPSRGAGDWENGREGDDPGPARDETPPGPYYTEPPSPGPERESQPAPPPPPPARVRVYEPPPPDVGLVYEPPPPPRPRHVAPKASIWLGGRVGSWTPFGALWAQCTAYWSDGSCAELGRQVPLNDFVRSGPSFEGNLGVRFERRYVLYAAWERAQLSGSDGEPRDPTGQAMPRSSGGDSDFFGGGMRVTTDPDRVGLLVDLTIGYRQMRARWDARDVRAAGQPRELRMTGALDFRMGIGADLRLGPTFSISPLASLGVGTFNHIDWISAGGNKTDALGDFDVLRSHAWLSLSVGGHFDLVLVE